MKKKPSHQLARPVELLIQGAQPIFALEKRIAFDGAAAATVTKVAAAATHRADDMSASLAAARVHGLEALQQRSETVLDALRSPSAQPAKSVVFIESDVPDIQTLIRNIDHSAQIVILDASKDGVDGIARYLSQHKGVQNVYIFSHGSDANLELGSANLNSATMQGRYATDLASIKSSLGRNANISVYGCDFAEYADGDSAARLLSHLTGASVAASTNNTGGAKQGGDFVLEDHVGKGVAPEILNSHLSVEYNGLLAAQNTGAFTINTGTSGTATSSATVATAYTADGAIKVVVTVTPAASNSSGSITTTTGGTFDSTAPTSSYTTSVNGAAALEETLQFGGTSGGTDGANSATIQIAYFDAKTGAAITVTNPIINIDRIGGSAVNSSNQSVSNSSDLSIATAGATLTRLSGSSNAFNVSSTDVYETVNTLLVNGFSADANSDPTKGTSAGTVQVNGSFSTLTFNWSKAAGSYNGGDRIDLIFSADTSMAQSGTLPNKVYTDGQSGISVDTSGGFSNPSGLTTTYTATGLPAGLSIDSATGKISGTIDHDASKNGKTTSGSGATLDGTYNVVVTATNSANNSATQAFTIDSKNTAPTLGTKTTSQTNNDGDTITAVNTASAFSDPNGDPLTYAATGLPTGLSISSAGVISGTVAKNAAPGTYSVMVTATDDKGAATSETFNWVVKDVSPTATGTLPNQVYTDGQSGISIATSQGFSDSVGNTLTYSATGLPAGLSIDAATGKITGTIDHDASANATTKSGSGATLDGTYAIKVTASDGLGGTATQSFTIDSKNTAPTVGTKTANQTNSDGDTITAVNAASAFSDPNGDPLTYTASGLPNGLSISAAGVISGTVAKNAAPGTYSVTVTATDDKGAATAETFNWVINDVPPTTSGTLANQVYTDGQSGISIATSQGFTDPNGNTLTYTATGLPAGLTIDATTGKITGTIDHDASKNASTRTGSGATLDGAYTVKITASDGLGGSAAQTFTIDSKNTAPALGTKTVNQTNNDGDTITPVNGATAFSDPNGDPLTYSATNLPAGLTISPAGIISGTVAKNAAPGTYTVTVVATDDKGAATPETFTWTIKDVPPTTAGTLANQVYTDGQSGISIATSQGFTDSLGNTLTYSATGLPAGLTIDATTGKITGTIDHDASKNASTKTGSGATLDGTYNVVVTASDGLGGTATQGFKIDSKNTAPVLGTNTVDQSNKDGDTITPVNAASAFSDPNGDPLTYTAANLPAGLTISSAGVISGTVATTAVPGKYAVTVTATDDKGAATTETFNWIIDNVPPVAVGTLANKAYTDGQSGISITTAQGFTDANGNSLTYSAAGLPAGLAIDAATGKITGAIDHDASKNGKTTTGSGATLDGTYTVVVTAADSFGGQATQTFKIDSTNQAPTVGTATANQTSKDGQTITPVATASSFSDPNGDPLTYTASNLPAGLTIDSATGVISGTVAGNATPGTYAVRVLATDDKGASSREAFNWTIQDVPPTRNGTLPNKTYADSTANISIATAGGFTSPNGLALTYSATGLPSGLSIDPATGKVTGQLDHDASKNAPTTTGSGATLDGTYAIVVTASDGQGGSTTQTFKIDATNTAPTVTTKTPDQHSADGNAVSVSAASAFTDANTGDTLTYAASGLPKGLTIDAATGLISGTIDKTASATGPYTIKVTATDDKGAATTETFNWQVDNVPPQATPPLADKSAYDGSAVSYTTTNGFTNPNGSTLTYSATGLPTGLTIDPTTGVISGKLDHDASVGIANGVYTIAVTVSDGQGGSATNPFHLTASNQAPVVGTQTANQTSSDGQTITPVDVSKAFSDPNGDPLTYTASNLPAGLSIDSNSGVISGTVAGNATPGTYSVRIIATDDKGAQTRELFTWTVNDVPPTANGTLPNMTYADSTSSISIATSGGFNNPNGLALTYSVTGLPAGLSIDPMTGKITGQLDHDASKNAPTTTGSGATLDGTYAVNVSVSDGQGGTATQMFKIDATNSAPTVTANTLDQHDANGNRVSVDAAAAFSDANVGDTFTYTASGLPKGLTIDPNTGLISGTIDKSASTKGPYTVSVTETDDKGAATTETFHWQVDNVALVATPPLADKSAYDSSTVSYATSGGFTNPNNLALTYSATGLPAGLSINASTGVISGTLDHDASTEIANGVYTIAVTVNDGQGSSATNTFHLTASNQAPIVATKTSDQTSNDGQSVATVDASQAFSDPNGDPLTYSASNLPAGLTIDAATGKISGTVAANAAPGIYSVSVTATDDKGATNSETFRWTINNVPPATAGTLPNQTYADSAPVDIATSGGFTNPNHLALTYAASGLPSGLSIDPATGKITGQLDHDASAHAPATSGSGATLDGTYTIVVTASDGQGGTATQSFTLDAKNTAPTIETNTQDQHVSEGDMVSVNAGVAFSDANAGDTLTYTATNLPNGLAIDPATGRITGTIATDGSAVGSHTVTVTATDDKGAATTETFAWQVDALPPGNASPIPNSSAYDGTSVTIDTATHFISPDGTPLLYSSSALPAGLSIDATTGQITGTLDHDASKTAATHTGSGATLDGFYTITVTATGTGGSTSQTFTLDVANQAPTVTTKTVDQANATGQMVTTVDASQAFHDPNGDPLTYTASNLPAGLVIDPNSGKITGSIDTKAMPGTYAVSVIATDDKGAATVETFNWVVSDTPPVAAGTIAGRSYADSASGISIDTAGAFTSPNGLPLTYSVSGLPAGLSIDPATGKITGQIDHDASANAPTHTGTGATLDGTYTVTVTAADGLGGSVQQVFTIDATNTAPAIVATTADQHSADGNNVSVDASKAFADPNTGDTLVYTASGLPQGLTIDPATGLISGTIATNASHQGPYTVSVTSTDDKGAATTETFQWVVDNVPPVATPPLADRSAYDGSTVSYASAEGFLNPNGHTLTYSATGLPPNVTIDAATGVISGTLDHDASIQIANGVYTIAVTASDGQGGSATNIFHLTATDQAPVVGVKTADQGSTASQTVTTVDASTAFTDPNGDPLTYAASNLPAGLSIDAATGKITGTIAGNAQPGAYLVTVTATDDKGVANSETFNWAVDTVLPTANGTLPNQTFADGASNVSIGTAGGFTNTNGTELAYTASGLPKGLSIDSSTGVISGYIQHDASADAPVTSGMDGAYTVTVKATDIYGGAATQTFTLHAKNDAPTLSLQTPDQHSADSNSVSLDASKAFTDPNTGDIVTYAASGLPKGLTIDPNTGLITGTIDKSASASGPYTVFVTATDDKGAATTETFAWRVDNVAPMADPPLADRAVNDGTAVSIASADGFTNPNGLPLTYSATGLPTGLTIDTATGVISGTLDHDASAAIANGIYTIAVTADDGQGGIATSSFHLTAANQAPVVGTKTADQTASNGQTILPVDASQAFVDGNGDVLTYSASNLPTGLSIDQATGKITGMVDPNAKVGPYTVIVTATDDKGAATNESFTFTIDDAPPIAQGSLAGHTFADGASGVSIATAGGFSSPSGSALTYAATGLPRGLTIDPSTGVITGFVSHNASQNAPKTTGSGATLDGTYTVVVTATDAQGGATTQTFAIDATNNAPTLGTPTADQQAQDGGTVSIRTSTSFSDPNTGDTLTYTATGLPKGLSIDPATGDITGTLDTSASASGPYKVIVTATDNKGAPTSETFTFVVDDLPPATIGTLPNQAYTDNQSGISIATAQGFTDQNGHTLTYGATGLPAGLTIDPTTGVISGQIDHDASANAPKTTGSGATLDGTYTVVVTAFDGLGGATTQTFTIDSRNSAPALGTVTPNQHDTDGATISIDASKTFSGDGDTLAYSATNLPKGLAIDPATGVISGTIAPDASGKGPYSVTVTATDDKGAATSETFTWQVDNIPPTAGSAIAPVSASDGTAIMPIDTASHFDNPNGLPLAYTASGLPAGLSIDPTTGAITGTLGASAASDAPTTSGSGATLQGIYTIVVTASDGQGGTASQSFTFAAANDAPVIVQATPDQHNVDGGYASIDASQAFADPNGDALTFSATNLPPGLAIDPATGIISGTLAPDASTHGPYSVVVIATDDKGAATTETFAWQVDNTPPTASWPIAPVSTRDGTAIEPIRTADRFDNPNGLPLTYTASGLPGGLSIDPTTGRIAGALTNGAAGDAPMISGSGATLRGTYTIIVTVSDGQGGTASQSFEFTATNDAPVVVQTTPDQHGVKGGPASIDASRAFADPNGDRLTYSATNLPPGLVIDPNTGFISGTFASNASTGGPYAVSVTATDPSGAATSETFVWRVDTGVPPVAVVPYVEVRAIQTAQLPTAAFESVAPQVDTGLVQTTEHVDGVILDAVNHLVPLDGWAPLGQHGIVVATVEAAIRPLPPLDSPYATDIIATAPVEYLGSSSRADNFFTGEPGVGLNVETLIRDRMIIITANNRSDIACVVPVKTWEITQADGSTLPDWLHLETKGSLIGKVPSGVETIDIKIKATLANGIVTEQRVTIDTGAGHIDMHRGPGGGRHAGRSLSDMMAADGEAYTKRVNLSRLLV